MPKPILKSRIRRNQWNYHSVKLMPGTTRLFVCRDQVDRVAHSRKPQKVIPHKVTDLGNSMAPQTPNLYWLRFILSNCCAGFPNIHFLRPPAVDRRIFRLMFSALRFFWVKTLFSLFQSPFLTPSSSRSTYFLPDVLGLAFFWVKTFFSFFQSPFFPPSSSRPTYFSPDVFGLPFFWVKTLISLPDLCTYSFSLILRFLWIFHRT